MKTSLYSRSAPELKARAEGEGKLIAGYAAVFYDGTPRTEYELWSGVVERIMPSAFDRAIGEDDVRGLYNHDVNFLLGRTRSGTMRLSKDAKGLVYEIDVDPESTVHRTVAAALARGDLDGSSFSFLIEKETRIVTDDLVIYEIQSVKPLFDVGPVAFPAYENTTAGLRSGHIEERRRDVEAARAGWKWRPAALRARARAMEVV